MFVFGMTQEQVDQMKMESEENMNTLHRIFDELDPEDLNEIRDFLAAVAHDTSLGFYWIGVMDAKLRGHEFVKLTESDNEEVTIPNSQPGERPDKEPKWVQGMLDLDGEEAGTSAENIEKNMELYEVKRFYGPLSTESTVECIGCGTVFSSLEDRMRREPGAKGCTGCQNKAKWG